MAFPSATRPPHQPGLGGDPNAHSNLSHVIAYISLMTVALGSWEPRVCPSLGVYTSKASSEHNIEENRPSVETDA